MYGTVCTPINSYKLRHDHDNYKRNSYQDNSLVYTEDDGVAYAGDAVDYNQVKFLIFEFQSRQTSFEFANANEKIWKYQKFYLKTI